MTKKQQQVLEFIKSYMSKYSLAPTIAEIAKALGLKSRSVIHKHLQGLAEQGLVKIIANKKRNIELVDDRQGCLPIVGTIAAGKPIEAIENVEWLDIADRLFAEDKFLLKVTGNSMIEDNICDGDLIVCRKASQANNGEIVVALIDSQEATLKHIKKQNDRVVLIPANESLLPQIYSADRVQIQGIFVGLFRFM